MQTVNHAELATQETVFLECADYFKALLDDMAHAHTTIDLETYIFDQDNLGATIADALIAAAIRGVRIRILVDSAGTPSWGGSFTKRLEAARIETRIFHPFPWRLWQWSRAKIRLSTLVKALYLLFKINARNHRKVCIIDKKIVYVGSANISNCHLKKEEGGKNWRDTAVKLINTDISDLQTAFDTAWNYLPIQGRRLQDIFMPVKQNPIFRLNNTRHRRRSLYKNLLHRAAKCKERIWITNAYFVPDNFLLRKLNERARAGIDVRIVLPQKSDVFIMPWAATAFYESLLKAGVRIFEYIPSMLHAKTLILDDWFIVGSSNLNHRSLLHDLEVDVNIRSTTCKRELEAQFLRDLNESKEIRLSHWHKRSILQKIIGRLVLYIKYWI
jgi:cardiolipin synthase